MLDDAVYFTTYCDPNRVLSCPTPLHVFRNSTDTGFPVNNVKNASGVAVDPATGRVFVADPPSGTVYIFKKDGASYLADGTLENLSNPRGVAFDNGVLYVSLRDRIAVEKNP
jgi:DNA-binding beta-propeller fold protein YncE